MSGRLAYDVVRRADGRVIGRLEIVEPLWKLSGLVTAIEALGYELQAAL